MKRRIRMVLGALGMSLLWTRTGLPEALPPASGPAAESRPGMGSLLRLGDMAQAASDLRKAGEAFEHFGSALDSVAGTLVATLAEMSRHHAAMSKEFDPFGLKIALETIREQNRVIQELQQAQIERLQAEIRALEQRRVAPRRRRRDRVGGEPTGVLPGVARGGGEEGSLLNQQEGRGTNPRP